MRHAWKTLGLLIAAPLALMVGCADVEEPFGPADEPGMERQQEGTWGTTPEEARPPEGGMQAPPAEQGGMGAPPPEGALPGAPDGAMPAPPDAEGAMDYTSPEGAPDAR